MGGDLKFHLKDGGFSRERARFYAAEVALGLGHIHSLGIIIRDLKPRNILLNGQGHCQISDLGLAVNVGEGRTIRGRAGTDGYWSPEVINGYPYSYDADWWSYGICLFEFISGFSPFSCKHTGLRTRNEGIRRGDVRFPEGFDETAKPLVLALLNLQVADRLGCRGQGVDEVLAPGAFEYWRGLDVDAIRRNEMPAPWLPQRGTIYAASQVDINENNDEAENRKIKILPEDHIDFDNFVDVEEHQRDVVRVLELKMRERHRLSLSSPIFDHSTPDGGGGCCLVS
jgi:serine/threonine protein kinase